MIIKRFWTWNSAQDDEPAELRLDGAIAESSWFDDDITPALFRSELERHQGDLVVWINSPGGDVFAASQIYTMLMEHAGKVTVKIDGIAASAASVIAMAGTEVLMSPSSMMMIHNPMTIAFGWKDEMEHASEILDEVKASIINAYELKTNLSREIISTLMDDETWMNANKALELGFCDGVLFQERESEASIAASFAAKQHQHRLLTMLAINEPGTTNKSHQELMTRLNLLRH